MVTLIFMFEGSNNFSGDISSVSDTNSLMPSILKSDSALLIDERDCYIFSGACFSSSGFMFVGGFLCIEFLK